MTGDHIPETIYIVDSLGGFYRDIEEFEFYEKADCYKYRGYRRVNGVVYHTFVYKEES